MRQAVVTKRMSIYEAVEACGVAKYFTISFPIQGNDRSYNYFPVEVSRKEAEATLEYAIDVDIRKSTLESVLYIYADYSYLALSFA